MRLTGSPPSIAIGLAAAALAATGCSAAGTEAWDVDVSVGELSPAPFGTRVDHSFVWSGEELFVWGGGSEGQQRLHDDGAAYSPDTDSWRVVAEADLEARARHTTVLLEDQRVLVWGGATGTYSGDEDGRMARDGAIYDPGLDSWEPVADAPVAGEAASAAAVGGHVVFGGSGYQDELLVYSLEDDTWDTVPLTGTGEWFRVYALAAVDDGVVLLGATREDVFTGSFRPGEASVSVAAFADAEEPYGAHLGLAALPGGQCAPGGRGEPRRSPVRARRAGTGRGGSRGRHLPPAGEHGDLSPAVGGDGVRGRAGRGVDQRR